MRTLPRIFAVALMAIGLVLPSLAAAAPCPIDTTSGLLQYGAASGGLATPISLPQLCDVAPLEVTASAGPLGGTYWQGTGRADPGVLSTDYVFTIGSGWWGYSVASMGTFFIPDLVITGGPDPVVAAAVNVAYGGAAGGAVPSSQDVQWAVDFRDPAGNLLSSHLGTLSYAPNGPVQTASSPLLGNLPVGTPFSLQMRAQWFHQGGPGGGSTTSGTGFLELLAAEILSLPSGYTLSSSSAGIVDNQLVPEPGTLVLLATTLAGLAWLGRRDPRA